MLLMLTSMQQTVQQKGLGSWQEAAGDDREHCDLCMLHLLWCMKPPASHLVWQSRQQLLQNQGRRQFLLGRTLQLPLPVGAAVCSCVLGRFGDGRQRKQQLRQGGDLQQPHLQTGRGEGRWECGAPASKVK